MFFNVICPAVGEFRIVEGASSEAWKRGEEVIGEDTLNATVPVIIFLLLLRISSVQKFVSDRILLIP
jgi:hypothetical protein